MNYTFFLSYFMFYNIFLILKVLGYFFLKQRWTNYIKNSFYMDYGLKFILKGVVYSGLIHTAYFFAEKYLIEYNTRYIFNYFSYSFYQFTLQLTSNRLLVFTTLISLNLFFILI